MANPESRNLSFQMGFDMDDLEVCEHYGIDTSYAYTDELNKLVFEAQEQENIDYFINEEGMDPKEARKEARRIRDGVVREHKKNGFKI